MGLDKTSRVCATTNDRILRRREADLDIIKMIGKKCCMESEIDTKIPLM